MRLPAILSLAVFIAASGISTAGAQAAPPSPGESATPSPAPTFAIPTSLSLTVSGHPATAAFVARAIQRAVRRAVIAALPAGTNYTLSAIAGVDLMPGAQAVAAVQVAVYNAADPSQPFEYTVQVTVANENPGEFAAKWLYFDDDPERVRADGYTLRATVPPGFPCRVYYYHQNAGEPRRFVFLIAPEGGASRVQILDSFAGPSGDPMEVGHKGSRAYLLAKPANQGEIIDLAEGEAYVVHDSIAKDGDVVNGIAGLRVVTGAPVTVWVVEFQPSGEAAAARDGERLHGDGHNRYGTFALEGYGSANLTYAIGGEDASVAYGGREPTPPNVVPGDPGRDYGDYGVLHEVTLQLSNPSATPATAYLYERPHGNAVRSSFLIDGSLVEVGCARASERYRIAPIVLEPGERRTVDLLTMTDGGSSYPLEVGVTATPPIETPPPINAPDGCFPKATSPP